MNSCKYCGAQHADPGSHIECVPYMAARKALQECRFGENGDSVLERVLGAYLDTLACDPIDLLAGISRHLRSAIAKQDDAPMSSEAHLEEALRLSQNINEAEMLRRTTDVATAQGQIDVLRELLMEPLGSLGSLKHFGFSSGYHVQISSEWVKRVHSAFEAIDTQATAAATQPREIP